MTIFSTRDVCDAVGVESEAEEKNVQHEKLNQPHNTYYTKNSLHTICISLARPRPTASAS